MPTYSRARVLSNNKLAGNFYQMFVRPESMHSFVPGQYIIIKINEERVAQYSLASTPDEDVLELLIDVTPDGVSSRYLKSRVAGDVIEHLPPIGRFVLRDDGAAELLFLATGSGIAPIKSILTHHLRMVRDTRIMTLRFGLRYSSDVFYDEYFKALAEEFPNLDYQLFLSQGDDHFAGPRGHITHNLDSIIGDSLHTSAYLCGSPDMIQEAEELLSNAGVPAGHIYYEKFWK